MTTLATAQVILHAETAAELMTPNPISLRDTATIREAVKLLTGRGFSAAPVIDAAGRPVGVLSRTDLLVRNGELAETMDPLVGLNEERVDLTLESGADLDAALVRDHMTPVVFSVTPETPAQRVIDDMLSLHVHRLFVVDKAGVLVGVIAMVDILKYLRTAAGN